MAMSPTDLDGFLPLLTTADTKAKLTIGAKLQTYLSEASSSTDPNGSDDGSPNIQCSDIGLFVDSLLPWIQSSNYKVSLQGLEIMIELCDKMRYDFRPFVSAILPVIIDRLGDSKETIRDKSQYFLMKLMETESISVQSLFDKLTASGFTHKNSNVREQCLKCLDSTLLTYGTKSLTVSKLVPFIVKLLSDPHSSVRDSAFNTLVVIYKFVGDRLKMDLTKKYPVPQNKLPALMAKFEDIKLSGELEPSAAAAAMTGSMYDDEVDRVTVVKQHTLQSLNRKMPARAQHSSVPETTGHYNSLPKMTRTNSIRKPLSSAGSSDAGGVSEDHFERAFDDVPSVQIFSSRDVEDHLNKIKDIISDANQDWNKRVDALKKVRSVVMTMSTYEELVPIVRTMEPAMETCVKDLRSQVVREACITIAYLSRCLRNKFDHFSEYILTSLMNLIPNSAKVISTSSYVAIRFILSNTHHPRLIPVITKSLSSKSKDIRRACCEFVELVLKTWPVHSLERQNANLQDAIKKGIADADPEAREYSRKAYWSFIEHFPDQGDALMNSLDPVYKRKLMSNSSSSSSLSRMDNIPSHTSSSSASPLLRKYTSSSTGGSTSSPSKPVIQPRSSSAIDLQAVQRAKVRAQYAALARQKIATGVGVGSLPRSRKNSISDVVPPSSSERERVGRTRSRVSMSTPTSRSGSPSSRLSYNNSSYSPNLPRPRRGSSGIPRSTDTSRESSPSRYRHYRSGGRPPIQPSLSRPPVMAQKILQQSREAESALADALDNPDVSRISPRKSFRPFDDHSDESETSSICSERSFDSFRRTSDSYSSWNGSQNRIYRDICESTAKDIGDIISNCESIHWNDRKDGLVNLQCYLQSGNLLSAVELKRVTDIFTKMFMDSHTKVFSLFLDCFNELIVTHHNELQFWLYLLVTRLLNKSGADLLGSVHSKVLKSLEVVRDCFPPHLQLHCVFRFLTDPTQTPNEKVKLSALHYVTKLATITDPSLAFPLPPPGSKDFTTLALTKMIGWTMGGNIKQGNELRRVAQETILALFNLNTPQITLRFSSLPKEYQEAVATLITTRVRKSSASSTSAENGGGSSLMMMGNGSSGCGSGGFNSLPSSPRLQSPLSSGKTPPMSLIENGENLNPDEFYKSLRRTTAEIQKLGIGGGVGGALDNGLMSSERGDSVSYDSGISQMSAPGLDERDTHLKERHDNGSNDKDAFTIQAILDNLKDSERKSLAERKSCLSTLHECIQVHPNSVGVHFKALLYQLISLSDDEEPTIREYSVTILNAMVKKPSIVHYFTQYIELVVLKVVNLSKDANKEVYKACENCALSFAIHLPSENVTRILFPLIVAEEYPINLIAIKMLTKLIEHYGKEPVESYMPNIMPALLQAYENQDSCVRKCSVFCMVALYKEFGDNVLSPYINRLSGAKLKLLQLYIKRSQQHSSSVPTSPKSNI